MDKTPSQVQTTETTSHQDIEHSDESLDGLRAVLYPDRTDLYNGPDAYTAQEIAEMLKLHPRTITGRIKKATKCGDMVKVKVLRNRKGDGGEYVAAAWVLKAVYNQWSNNNAGSKQHESTGD